MPAGLVAGCPKCPCSSRSTGVEATVKATEQPKRFGLQIYFCTRTHKQISQITHEMARTAYNDTPMAILASREHTCVHPTVSTHKSKNDECKKLLDYDQGVSCCWYHNVHNKLTCQSQLRAYGLHTAWDIEDLVRLGKKITVCPYYATRGLKDEADVIFCPYNYLIDPMIRELMLIDISKHVIIFDEGHNMEDSARSAASLSLTSLQVKDVIDDIDDILKALDPGDLRDVYKQLQALCRAVTRWMDATAQRLPPRGYEQAHGIWPGREFLPILQRELGLTAASVGLYAKYLKQLTDPERSEKDRQGRGRRELLDKPPCISMSSIMLLKGLLIVVGYLFKHNMKYLPDYRVALLKMTTSRPVQDGEWISRRRRSRRMETVWTYSLNFWCLNPAVAFSDLAEAHSIILTSGTLSPMSSFSSELGVAFPIQLEANHVIPEPQTWVRSLSHGPSNKSLIANYQNSETFEFQDEVGNLVLQVCQIVPYGVLCFLSSYNMLEKLAKRWQDTGLWSKLMQCKAIVTEPRGGGKAEFEIAMSRFYEAISDYQHVQEDGQGDSEGAVTGALFFAVCRGKVSEGLDFTDNNARAVITIGIPFPYIKDRQVALKREYNNEHCQQRGLLSGSEWYEIQAYRALNQALGRCIRHKKDWGAIILVDERFSKGTHYTKGLSKWVRRRHQNQSNFQQAMASLHSFVANMVASSLNHSATDHSILFPCPPSSSSSSSFSTLSVATPANLQQPSSSSLSLTSTPIVAARPRPEPLKLELSSSPLPLPLGGSNLATSLHQHSGTPSLSLQLNAHLGVGGATVNEPYRSRMALNANPAANPQTALIRTSVETPQNSLTSLPPKRTLRDFMTAAATSLPASSPSTSTLPSQTQPAFSYPNGLRPTVPAASSLTRGSSVSGLISQPPVKLETVEGGALVPECPTDVVWIESTPPEKSSKTPDEIISMTSASHISPCIVNTLATSVAGRPGVDAPVVPGTPQLSTLVSPVLFGSGGPLAKTPAPPTPKLSDKVKLLRLQTPPSTPKQQGCSAVHLQSISAVSPLLAVASGQAVSTPVSGGRSGFDDVLGDDDATPPISPRKQQEKGGGDMEVDGHLSFVKSKPKLGANISTKSSSPFGKPKRRLNIRVAKRLTTATDISKYMYKPATSGAGGTCSPGSASLKADQQLQERDDSDDGDFKVSKPLATPKKQAKAEVATIQCSCGELVSRKAVAYEKAPVKDIFSSKYGSYRPQTVQSSRLWGHLRAPSKGRKRCLQALIVAESDLKCITVKESGEYNSVWEQKLGVCYSLLQCKKGHTIGAHIHCTSNMSALVGKALLSAEAVQTT